MGKIASAAAIAACFVLVSACQSTPRILETSGPTDVARTDTNKTLNNPTAKELAGEPGGQYRVFGMAYNKAWINAQIAAGGTTPAGWTYTPQQAELSYKQMALEGFAAVNSNCSDFFSSGGDNEKWIAFGRDAVAVAGGIATGALALVGASPAAIAVLSLSTVTAYSTLDTYTKNFLFGAENISTVRTLIMNALAKHQTAVFAVDGPWTFGDAIGAILDHQEICRSSAIVNLVKAAIQNGEVVASKPSSESDQAIEQKDKNTTLQIARTLELPNGAIPSEKQLAGLYGYYHVGYTVPQLAMIKNIIKPLDRGPCNDKDHCFPDAGYKTTNGSAWDESDDALLSTYLDQFSTRKKTALNTLIDAFKKETKGLDVGGAKAFNINRLPETAPSSEAPNRHFTVTVP